jgi:hypothetical protein
MITVSPVMIRIVAHTPAKKYAGSAVMAVVALSGGGFVPVSCRKNIREP